MLSFLKPTPRSLALFAVLAFICVGGAIQSYAFIDDARGVPKPPFYDLLKPLELWVPWIFFAAPVHLLGSLLGLRWLLRCFPSLGGVSAPVASLAYAYVISCWAVHSWDRWARYGRYGKLSPLVGIALASIFCLPLVSLPAGNPLEYAARVISGFAFLSVVFATYSVSIQGLYRALLLLAKSLLIGSGRLRRSSRENPQTQLAKTRNLRA